MSVSTALSGAAPAAGLGVLQWITPALTPKTVVFGVRIPADRAGTPVIRQELRHFRIGVSALTLAAVTAALLLSGGPTAATLAVLIEVVGGACLYLIARARIAAAKQREDWFAGLKQVVAADTTLRTAPQAYPWKWELPSYLLVIATLATGIVRYPSAPERIPTHFRGDGRADQYAAKSVVSMFAIVGAQALLTLLVAGLARLTTRSRSTLDVQDPDSALRHRIFVVAMARCLLVLAFCTALTLLSGALEMWGILALTGAAATPLMAAPIVVALAVLIGTSIRLGQNGSRIRLDGRSAAVTAPAGAGTGAAPVVNRDDDRFYKLGLFYFNRDDPSFLVPKRFGVGWTVNMARPAAWLLVAALVLAVITVPVLHAIAS